MIYRRGIKRAVMFVVVGTAAAAVLGLVVMSLWNWLAPALFGGKMITFWQGLGILVLSRILFGGFFRRHNSGGRARIIDRWERMTPEEREKFRTGMRRGCGVRGPAQGDVQA